MSVCVCGESLCGGTFLSLSSADKIADSPQGSLGEVSEDQTGGGGEVSEGQTGREKSQKATRLYLGYLNLLQQL